MIKSMQHLDMAEVEKLLGGIEESERKKLVDAFIKKFSKISSAKEEQLKKELTNLGISKIKQENITKIIDLLPEDAIDLNKIFIDFNLDEDETNKILEVVKKYG